MLYTYSGPHTYLLAVHTSRQNESLFQLYDHLAEEDSGTETDDESANEEDQEVGEWVCLIHIYTLSNLSQYVLAVKEKSEKKTWIRIDQALSDTPATRHACICIVASKQAAAVW